VVSIEPGKGSLDKPSARAWLSSFGISIDNRRSTFFEGEMTGWRGRPSVCGTPGAHHNTSANRLHKKIHFAPALSPCFALNRRTSTWGFCVASKYQPLAVALRKA
jgi:hypothetical protein